MEFFLKTHSSSSSFFFFSVKENIYVVLRCLHCVMQYIWNVFMWLFTVIFLRSKSVYFLFCIYRSPGWLSDPEKQWVSWLSCCFKNLLWLVFRIGETILRVILSVLASDSGLCVAGRNHTSPHWEEERVVISTFAPNKNADPSPS